MVYVVRMLGVFRISLSSTTANSEKKVEGATWTSVSAGGEDPGREAAHWKEVAEQGFRESARLRAMVQALRSTFEEVEQENEELHVAYAMQQREILTLGHHLEFKTLETETLIANFERAMSEMDDEMYAHVLPATVRPFAVCENSVYVQGMEPSGVAGRCRGAGPTDCRR